MDDTQAKAARKTYYVSVGAGQILEDPEAASYELIIRANEEELNRLQELFEELSSWDEAETWHFSLHPFGSATQQQMSSTTQFFIEKIYNLLHELGTDETRAHIESMHLNVRG
ncbi:hypothetical protein IDH44_05600 [Paenibacillus sp. IB182496]|uniref:Hydrolase n=1 Tax=Paenibacillus sabuli TaxID=2772509 RepID=A0A927BRN7_9BACL|nr:hypothetical protein [Paenibacillus sabuli]MBD2844656.1 hypothetical protein [Paenibacillus sabuli]